MPGNNTSRYFTLPSNTSRVNTNIHLEQKVWKGLRADTASLSATTTAAAAGFLVLSPLARTKPPSLVFDV